MERFFLFIIIVSALSCTRYRIIPCEPSSMNEEKDFTSILENASLFYDLASVDETTKRILNKKYDPFEIVNPGEQYNPTDIPMDMPGRRLIFGGKYENVTFLLFEEGSIGVKTKCVFIVKYVEYIKLYSIALPPVRSISDLITILKQNKYPAHSCDEFR